MSRFPAGSKYSVPPCIESVVLLAPSTGPNAPSQVPLVLLEDVSNVYGDVEVDRSKHIHKKRKLAEGREKPMVIRSDLIISICLLETGHLGHRPLPASTWLPQPLLFL